MEKWRRWRKAKDDMSNRDKAERQEGTAQAPQQPPQQQKKPVSHLDETVGLLLEAILQCEEYLAYRAELEKVRQFPELKEQIDEFRKRNYVLQTSADIDFDKLDRFEKEYEDFRSNPLVSDFLAAELAFCRRMQGIENRVTAGLDFQ